MKKELIILVVVVVLALSLGGFYFLLTSRRQTEPARETATPVAGVVDQEAADWARTMLKRYPYQEKAFYGVLSAARADEVWVVGFRTAADLFYPVSQQLLGVENKYGKFQGNISGDTLYTTQKGVDLKPVAEATIPATIEGGQLVAARMTFANNFALILEMRRLVVE